MRELSEIAIDIAKHWLKAESKYRIKFQFAMPYLVAMMCLKSTKDNYGFTSGRSVVVYFLKNASTWKGVTARRLKKELKEGLK